MLTQNDFEKLISSLRLQQTESTNLDCKEELFLRQEGDKASFIRDVAALANNIDESFLIIGIRNKTWEEIGLPKGSLLLNADQTQSQMNQIIENKIDPLLSIRYQVFTLNNNQFGVVTVKGISAPYIISIPDSRFGGNKTKGEPAYIYRGCVYLRHGDTTIIANRQSQILTVMNYKNISDSNKEIELNLREYLKRNAYLDVDSPEFGRNQYSEGLVEKCGKEGGFIEEEKHKAKSWVSFIFYPVGEPCKVTPYPLLKTLQAHKKNSGDSLWYLGLPTPVLEMFLAAKATPKSISGHWKGFDELSKAQYYQVVDITSDGIIHFAATTPLFYQRNNLRHYNFVSIIGYLWQFIHLTNAVYKDVGCNITTKLFVNFIGSKETYLANLAKGPTKNWIDLFDWRYQEDTKNINQEENIQISREYKISESAGEQVESLIRDIAEEIGHYYNQPTPRCFTPDTNEFPVRQFFQENNW